MFGNIYLKSAIGAAAVLISMSTAADDLALEPCIDGGVSPSGTYPTAALERQAIGYQNWPNFAPYYLFAVSATYLESPFDAAPEAGGEDTAASN